MNVQELMIGVVIAKAGQGGERKILGWGTLEKGCGGGEPPAALGVGETLDLKAAQDSGLLKEQKG